VREIDAAALEYAALLDYAADTTTAFGTLPGIGAKWLAVDRRERIGDALLQASQILPDCR
jgi:MOSC domain-containing protein YiiM